MPRRRWLIPLGVVALLLALLAVFASIGADHDAITGLSAVLYLLIRAGTPALAYLAGAVGLGRLCGPWIRASRDAPVLQAACGLAIMLSLSHLLGVLGLLAGRMAMPVGAGTVAIGVVLLGHQLASERNHDRATVSPIWLLGMPAFALLLVAACQPPGWLWDSEAGGYDALSYHLQLPQEWLAGGRVWPVTHNVFSFLPSYVESAFVHLGAMTGAPALPTTESRAPGLIAGEGTGVISCQFLSVGIALAAVAVVARLGISACRRAGLEGSGAFAGLLLLCTPWTVVVGSLAYNDLAVVALIAAAMLAAMDDQLSGTIRGVLAGFLIGAACGCKPTALLFGAPPVGIALLAGAPMRRWAGAVLPAAGAGLLTLAPWLIRNWLACGNPVFPQAAAWFGSAHWTADQAQRYAAAVSFHGSFADRLRLMFLVDPSDPAGARHRGLLHPQWFAFFGVASAATALVIAQKRTRRIGIVLGAGLLTQLLAWLLFTHIQSRFLLPLAAPACALFAVAVQSARAAAGNVPVLAPRTALASLACLAQTAACIFSFAQQRGGHPNQLLLAGPGIRSGESFRRELAALSPADRAKAVADLPHEAFLNLSLPPGATTYLLGDATPLYYSVPVLYNTTWDRWPLAEAMRAAPTDPGAWSRALSARGVRFVLVNPSEIERLIRSGWADPLITGPAVTDWLARSARLVKSWPQSGIALFELLPSLSETSR